MMPTLVRLLSFTAAKNAGISLASRRILGPLLLSLPLVLGGGGLRLSVLMDLLDAEAWGRRMLLTLVVFLAINGARGGSMAVGTVEGQ